MKANNKSSLYPEHVINGVKASIKEADQEMLFPYKGIREMLVIGKEPVFKKNKK